jgi:hypothetical protein
MEIKLTNEQLALLLDDFDSGIIDYKCYKYRVLDAKLTIKNLYDDYVDWNVAENPIALEYGNTVLLPYFTLGDTFNYEGMVYDTLILCRKNTKIDENTRIGFDIMSEHLQEQKIDTVQIHIAWDTYDCGSGQDVVDLKNDNIAIPQIRKDTEVILTLTLERIIDDITTLDHLLEDYISNEDKINLLNDAVIEDHEDIYDYIRGFIEMLNNELEKDEDNEEEYVYMEKNNEIIIFKTYITDDSFFEPDFGQYPNNVELKFTIKR